MSSGRRAWLASGLCGVLLAGAGCDLVRGRGDAGRRYGRSSRRERMEDPRGAAARCVPGTDEANQDRTEMKHRPLPATLAGAVATSVPEMLAWPGVARAPGRHRGGAVDAREAVLYLLTGDVWTARLSRDDCDVHLEVSAVGAGAGAPRVVLEIPQGAAYEGMREGLAAALRARGQGFSRATLAEPLRVRVAGYGFYDVHHACTRDLQRGCTHGTAWVGTLWELHPVVALEVVP